MMKLTLSQQFEIQKFNRIIDEIENVEELRNLSKQLLQAWQTQKSATLWAYQQSLPKSMLNPNGET